MLARTRESASCFASQLLLSHFHCVEANPFNLAPDDQPKVSATIITHALNKPTVGLPVICNMDNRPAVQVNVPPISAKRSANPVNGVGSIKPLSADRALQFTPFAHSVLPLVARIPIPEPARVRENAKVSSSAERAQARQLFQQQNLQALIQNELAQLLKRDDLTQM